MASEPKKFRIEKPEEDSSILVKTDIPEDSSKEIVKEELFKHPLGGKIKFTIKSDLTNATFIIEGKKIHAGKDFLSIHSPFFNALLNGNSFAERNKTELELNDVSYKEFHKMLQYLSNYSQVIKVEDVQSLLYLGDRFDIKFLTDRVEEFIISTKEFSVSEKLLLADKYRLVKLQVLSFDSIGKPGEQLMPVVRKSPEFKQLSVSAKKVFEDVNYDKRRCGTNYPLKKNYIQSSYSAYRYDYLPEVDKVEEPANGFIATGLLAVRRTDMYDHHDSIDVAGLLWTVHENYGKDYVPRVDGLSDEGEGDETAMDITSITLFLNRHRPTTAEWTVKGFVELEMQLVNVETGRKVWQKEKKYAFSFDNTKRVGRMKIDGKCTMETERNDIFLTYVTIYIEEISGVRKSPKFDFTNSSEFSDSTFIVEEKKIHVNKQYLSTISPRFFEMFIERYEVQLKNVKYEDMLEFLHWIYPTSGKKFTASSIVSVLIVAKELGVDIVNSTIRNFLADTDGEVLISEKMFLYIELNFGEESWLTESDWYLQGSYHQLKNSELFAKMTEERKLALADWINKRE